MSPEQHAFYRTCDIRRASVALALGARLRGTTNTSEGLVQLELKDVPVDIEAGLINNSIVVSAKVLIDHMEALYRLVRRAKQARAEGGAR